MTDKTDRELLIETHYEVTSIKQLLKGYNGDIGLCKQVENNSRAITKLWICMAVIVASAGGGSYAIIQTLFKMGG